MGAGEDGADGVEGGVGHWGPLPWDTAVMGGEMKDGVWGGGGGEGLLADERGGFIQFDGPLEAGGDGVDCFRDFVAVERKSGFEAEGIAGAEADGFEAEGRAALEQRAGEGFGELGADIKFEAILAGIAGAGDEGAVTLDGDIEKVETFEGGEVEVERGFGDLDSGGALEGELRPVGGGVADGAVKGDGVVANPLKILEDIGGIDDEEEVIGVALIDDEVIDDAAILVAHQGVEGFAVVDTADIIGEEDIEEGGGLRAFDSDFAHVADVEKPGV